MKHKTSKMKKVTLIALASVCALSTAAAISAGQPQKNMFIQ